MGAWINLFVGERLGRVSIMSEKDKVKQLKRMSRKFVPRRTEQEIPLRKGDPKDLRRSAREDILDELAENDLDEEEGIGPDPEGGGRDSTH